MAHGFSGFMEFGDNPLDNFQGNDQFDGPPLEPLEPMETELTEAEPQQQDSISNAAAVAAAVSATTDGADNDDDATVSEDEDDDVVQVQPATPVASSQHYRNAHMSPSMHTTSGMTMASQFSPGGMQGKTEVDGHGMWTAWTRVFDQPRYACLDLLDNSLDATLHDGFQGRVVMKRLAPNGIVIMNNSAKPIKALKDVLTIYKSTKRDGDEKGSEVQKTDAIGENGVGLKHGCATLSDTSFVLSRNFNTFSFGVIAKSLQTHRGICLPCCEFTVEEPDDKEPEEIAAELRIYIEQILDANPKIKRSVKDCLGSGDLLEGIKKLHEHCNNMWAHKDWAEHDHVFQVILCELLHDHSNSSSSQTNRRAGGKASWFLDEMKELLPKFYINIPAKDFQFLIVDDSLMESKKVEKVRFSYWQHRLVELTKFEVKVPREEPFHNIKHENWFNEGYDLSIYCGFEPLRVVDEGQGDACAMYIYSRRSGRLIQIDDDARATLRLPASGADFQQGLTIIIDDLSAQLPLMPTKQGIAWSEQRGGETHKRNLYAWAGACAQCFWQHHIREFQNRCKTTKFKTLLKEAVKLFSGPVTHHLEAVGTNPRMELQRLEVAKLTKFVDVDWKREPIKGSTRWKIKKVFQKPLDIEPGEDTLFKFTDETYPDPADLDENWAGRKSRAKPAAHPQQPSTAAPHPEAVHSLGTSPMQSHTSKKRKASTGEPEVISIDDDDDSGDEFSAPAPPAVHGRRQVARKSTGGMPPTRVSSNNIQNGRGADMMVLQRTLQTCQQELIRQKHLMVSTQRTHHETVRKLKEELDLAKESSQYASQQIQRSEELKEAEYQVIILERSNKMLRKDKEQAEEQHVAEVSGLKLEIEALKRKSEEQDHIIKKLQEKEGKNGVRIKSEEIREEFGGDDSV